MERQRGVDELKEKEEKDESGRERKRKKMRKKSTMFALALREMRRIYIIWVFWNLGVVDTCIYIYRRPQLSKGTITKKELCGSLY